MSIKKVAEVVIFATLISCIFPSCEKGKAGNDSKTVPKTAQKGNREIRIEKQGIEDLAPGIAVEKDGKIRYFTAGHWFGTINEPGSYLLHDGNDVFPVIRVDYIGNDIVEVIIGEIGGVAATISGVAPTGIEQFDAHMNLTGLQKAFTVRFMGSERKMVCFGSYDTVLSGLDGQEKRNGFICDPGGKMVQPGDSGLPLADEGGNLFLLSGSSPQTIVYENEGISVRARQLAFIQPLKF